MTSVQSDDARVQSLVAQFVEIGMAQYDAIYVIDTIKYNRLYAEMKRVWTELKKCRVIDAGLCCRFSRTQMFRSA
jgi:hypothetical protein